jgi:hypothetical protein
VTALGPAPTAPGTFLCPRCGHALRDEQAWCLDCGLAARTRVHPPPSWRVPVALSCVVLALLAAGIAVALVTLLDTPQATPAPATVTVPATTATPPAATFPTTAPTPTTATPTVTTPPTATAPVLPTPPSAQGGATQPTTPLNGGGANGGGQGAVK